MIRLANTETPIQDPENPDVLHFFMETLSNLDPFQDWLLNRGTFRIDLITDDGLPFEAGMGYCWPPALVFEAINDIHPSHGDDLILFPDQAEWLQYYDRLPTVGVGPSRETLEHYRSLAYRRR